MFGFNALSQQPFSTQDLELIDGVASLVATSSTTASGERLRTGSAAVTGALRCLAALLALRKAHLRQ